jgi:tRNA A-37 threonylcarbamoyl transferase component Bud32
MALRMVATKPNPALVTLPWHLSLDEWGEDVVVPLPRGISRHIVRIVRLGQDVYAVKQTRERMADREYRLLRDLRRLGLPTVEPVGVVRGREAPDGEEIEPALVTRHLQYSLPYRSLFSHGLPQSSLPKILDALVVLLVRLHLAGFFWGDVSLSNVLFRRSAGEFAAYLVDAETGELHEKLTDGQRGYDLDVALTNIYGELLDLQAGRLLSEEFEADEIIARVQERYDGLWHELTGTEEFTTNEIWRIEQRMERLNELGFDVDELDIVTDWDGATVRMQPKVVEANHHARDLQRLTGLDVEDNQARRLLNDLAAFTAHHDLGGESRAIVAHRWLTTVYEPITAMVPAELRGRLEPAEVFHEILEHRWFLSEQAGHPVSTRQAAQSYIDTVLTARPEEALAGDPETGEIPVVVDDEEPATSPLV